MVVVVVGWEQLLVTHKTLHVPIDYINRLTWLRQKLLNWKIGVRNHSI